jgi:hypothetical protein
MLPSTSVDEHRLGFGVTGDMSSNFFRVADREVHHSDPSEKVSCLERSAEMLELLGILQTDQFRVTYFVQNGMLQSGQDQYGMEL